MDEKSETITPSKPSAKKNSPIRIFIGIVAGIILAILYLFTNFMRQYTDIYRLDSVEHFEFLLFALSIGISGFIVVYKYISLSKTKDDARSLSLLLVFEEAEEDGRLTSDDKESWDHYFDLISKFRLLPKKIEFYQDKASRIPSGLAYYWLSIVFAFVGFASYKVYLLGNIPKENSLVIIGMLIPDLVYGLMLGLGIYKDTYLFT